MLNESRHLVHNWYANDGDPYYFTQQVKDMSEYLKAFETGKYETYDRKRWSDVILMLILT